MDIFQEKVEKIYRNESPIQDAEIEEYLKTRKLDLTATTDGAAANADADFVIISAPTNYDPQKNLFDCSTVETVINLVLESSDTAMMVIKSTIFGHLPLCQKPPLDCKEDLWSLGHYLIPNRRAPAGDRFDTYDDCVEKVYTRDLFRRD